MSMQFDAEAWSKYFTARASSLNLAWMLAKGAYKSFRQVRVDLQLPILDDGDGTAWTTSLAQEGADLQAMVDFLLKVASDVVSGTRGVAWNTEKQDFYIEKLPSDEFRIGFDELDVPRLVSNKTGEVYHASGTVSAPADLSIYATPLRAYVRAEAACFSLRSFSEARTLSTLGAYRQKLVDQGPARSVEQGNLLVHAIEDSSKGVYDAATASLETTSKPTGFAAWSPTEKALFLSATAGVISVLLQVYRTRKGAKD